MKRRSFFAALSALCAVPAVAMLPKAPTMFAVGGALVIEIDAPGGPLFPGDQLGKYLRAEYVSARMHSMESLVAKQWLDWQEVIEQRRQEIARFNMAADGARLVPHIQGEYSA